LVAITTYDIARKAGVHQSTVSRVLSGFPHVHPQTAERVRQACRELDYVPNAAPRPLRTRRSSAIAVHLPVGTETVLADPFVPVFLSAVSRQAARHGYSVLLSNAGSEDDETSLAALIQTRRADGAIVTSPAQDDPTIETLARERIPCVLGRYEGQLSRRMVCVDIDNRHTGRQAGRFLAARGHRRIGLVTEPPEYLGGRDFRAGFIEALTQADVTCATELLKQSPITFEAAFRAASELLVLRDPPTAIVVNTELKVFGVLEAVRQSGRNVLVLGVESPLLVFQHPRLPRIRAPIDELGRRMAATLIAMLGAKSPSPQPQMLRAQIIDENGNVFGGNDHE